MDQRLQFIAACQTSSDSFLQICRRFAISRSTGYKWVQRYELHGPGGLEEASRAPRLIPHRTSDQVVSVLVELRKQHPLWGPKKLRALLLDRHPTLPPPAASTIGDLLQQHGLIRPKTRRFRTPLPTQSLSPCEDPNALWCIDFKGHFALGDRTRCCPLTVTDAFSRYLLLCEAVEQPREGPVRTLLERLFTEFGLPDRIRSDNGPPFASVGLGGLTALSVWWSQLGIIHERIDPGHPEQNGRHERMHRTLLEDTAQPPRADARAQQLAMDRFRREFNEVRPHEALGQRPPATAYAVSRRFYPTPLRSPEYGEEYDVRRLDVQGRLSLRGVKLPVARCLGGEPVGLRAVTEQQTQLYYGPIYLGVVDRSTRVPRVLRAP